MPPAVKSCLWQGIVLICLSLAITGVIYQTAIRAVAKASHSDAVVSINSNVVPVVVPLTNQKIVTKPLTQKVVPVSNSASKALTPDDVENLTRKIKQFLVWVSGRDQAGVKSVLNWSRLANNEIHLMSVLSKFLERLLLNEHQNPGSIQALAQKGYQCNAQEQDQQTEISKTIHMDICSEIEWYKVIHLCWPEADSFLDVGANKGYLGSLFVALWGLNSFGITPAKIFEISTKLKTWESSRNPAGYCRDGYSHGIPLFCPSSRSLTTGECVGAGHPGLMVHSIDGSSYLSESLNDIITTQFNNSDVISGKVWKYFNFAMSDTTGSVYFTKQSKTSNPGFEGGSIKLDAGSNTEEVSMTTVDNFVREHKISDLDVLKIDTEGNDNKVIVGASTAIRKNVKLFTFEGGKGVVLSKEMLEQFDELGFSCYSTSRAGLFKWNGGCMPERFMGAFTAKDKGNIFCASRFRIPLVTLALDALSFPLLIKEAAARKSESSLENSRLPESYLQIKPFCETWPACVAS